MPDSLSSAALIANPTLSANPRRYSSEDGGNINRFVQQLRFVLPWRRINGQFLETRGHSPDASEVRAQFYDHESTGSALAPIPSTAYEFAEPNQSPTQQFQLKEITALYDSRDFSQQNLSRQYNQVRFQKRALRHAICSRLEQGLVQGNASENPAEFDGLFRLVERGAGQRVTASGSDGLDIVNEAMTRLRSHSGRCSLIVANQQAWLRLIRLQRGSGYRPVFRRSRRLKQRILYFDGVPVIRTDHIPTTQNRTSLFLLSFGKNGVFGLLARKKPRIYFTRTSQANAPFIAYQGHLFCGLASLTDDSLVEVASWSVRG